MLIVDDDDYVHRALAAALRSLHPAIVRASSAGEGIQIARERRPDLAIVDLGLPDRDGYELTRMLRADAEIGPIPILILTGHEPDEAAAREAGADRILGKPFRLHEFIEIVDGLLDGRPVG